MMMNEMNGLSMSRGGLFATQCTIHIMNDGGIRVYVPLFQQTTARMALF